MNQLNDISFFFDLVEIGCVRKYNLFYPNFDKGALVNRIVFNFSTFEKEYILSDGMSLDSIFYNPVSNEFYFSVLIVKKEFFIDSPSSFFYKYTFFKCDVFNNKVLYIDIPKFRRPYNKRSKCQIFFKGDHETFVSAMTGWIVFAEEEYGIELTEYGTCLYYKRLPMYLSSCKFNARDEIVFFNLETGKFEDKHLDLYTPPNFDK